MTTKPRGGGVKALVVRATRKKNFFICGFANAVHHKLWDKLFDIINILHLSHFTWNYVILQCR